MDKIASLKDAFSYSIQAVVQRGLWVFIVLWSLAGVIQVLQTKNMEALASAITPAASGTEAWNQFMQIWSGSLPLMVAASLVGFIAYLLLSGYGVKVLRGIQPPPEIGGWWTLLVDGVKLVVIYLVYLLPLLIPFGLVFYLYALPMFRLVFDMAGGPVMESAASQIGPLMTSLMVSMVFLVPYLLIAGILILLFSTIGTVRFARTGSIAEAFRFGPILAHIRRLGWISYIWALIVIGVAIFIVGAIVSFILMIPVVILAWVAGQYDTTFLISQAIMGVLLQIVQFALFVVAARYIALLYESVPSDV